MFLKEVLGKKFVDELGTRNYFAIVEGYNYVIFYNSDLDIKIDIQEETYNIKLNFRNDKDQRYLVNDWYLGTRNSLKLDDVFTIMDSKEFNMFINHLQRQEKINDIDMSRKISEVANKLYFNMNISNMTDTQQQITKICSVMAELLIDKNKKYGNSALEPINIFYKDNSINSISIRLDDKLSRIKNATELRTNDIVDIIGYLILLLIAKKTNITDIENLKD